MSYSVDLDSFGDLLRRFISAAGPANFRLEESVYQRTFTQTRLACEEVKFRYTFIGSKFVSLKINISIQY